MNTYCSRIFLAFLVSILYFSAPSWILANPLQSPPISSGLKVLEEIQDAISDLAERVTPLVVNVSPLKNNEKKIPGQRPRSRRAPGSGSGVIVAPEGLILTNNHVVGKATHAEIRFSDKTTLIGAIVGRDPDTDLALIKVEPDHDLPSATFGDSSAVKVGQWVLAVGNPFGLDRTVTLGVVSGIGRENMNLSRYENFIQTDASINPGNSGGPLFNLRGKVIGINTAIINFAQGIGFSIPSNMAHRVMTQLRQGGKVVRGWMGVGIQPLTSILAKQFGVPEGMGVLVNEVFEHDPADEAGIQPGDIITKIGQDPVETPNQLSRLVAQFDPGDTASVEIYRDGVQIRLPVALGVRKDKPVVVSLPPSDLKVNFGIHVEMVNEELAKKYHLDETEGVVVSQVDRGSIAYTEGLREGDVIREVNRVDVRTLQQYSHEMDLIRQGETVLLRVLREARAFYVVLKLQG